MKTLILSFILTRFFDYGITAQIWFDTPKNVICLAQTDKLSQYVDIKIKVIHEKVIGPVFIETNKGNFSMVPDKINKNGFTILRLFFRLKEQWVSIDSGITKIIVKTEQNVYNLTINNNLSNLKNYANEN
jgi:hypothetical protein